MFLMPKECCYIVTAKSSFTDDIVRLELWIILNILKKCFVHLELTILK